MIPVPKKIWCIIHNSLKLYSQKITLIVFLHLWTVTIFICLDIFLNMLKRLIHNVEHGVILISLKAKSAVSQFHIEFRPFLIFIELYRQIADTVSGDAALWTLKHVKNVNNKNNSYLCIWNYFWSTIHCIIVLRQPFIINVH
jgi:hypothetical protein